MSRTKGAHYETVAKQYITQAGCKILSENFYTHCGEIDLIAQDSDEIAFIEVKYRANAQFGGALYSITKTKQRKLVKAAQYYLIKNHKYNQMPCRFDVICIDAHLEIEWIKYAFNMQSFF